MERGLAEIAEELGGTRLAAELFDPDWNLVWVSDEFKTLLGEDEDSKIGIGSHVLEARTNDLWTTIASPSAQIDWTRANLPFILAETPTDLLQRIAVGTDVENRFDADEVAPRPAPPMWTYEIEYNRPGFATMKIFCVTVRILAEDGSRIGTAKAYGPALPAGIIDLVARGDEMMFARMANLVEPGRRGAAILFADLQASGALSRRISSAAYFRLIRALTTAIDDVIGRFGGVVGKHAGDGVTAFFLAEDAGSASAAVRAAIEAATAIGEVAAAVGAEHAEAGEVPMNIGLHWSGALYMGQVVTGGRLEVTALGDEMNECARIQQTARDGAVLASKALLERLDDADAGEVALDPDAIGYRTVAEIPGADEKSIRDAGGVAVAELSAHR